MVSELAPRRAIGFRYIAIGVAAGLVLLCFVAAPASAQGVRASVDRAEIGIRELVNLEIVIEDAWGAQIGRPEGADFGITSQSTSTSRELGRDGRMVSTTIVTLGLRPLRTGTLTIGSVPVRTGNGVLHTEPIEVRVDVEPPAAPEPAPQRSGPATPTRRGASQPRVEPDEAVPPPASDGLFTAGPPEVPRGEPFLVIDVTDASPVRGQQIIVDYILHTPRNALSVEAVELTEPEFAGFWFQEISDVRTRGSARLGVSRVNGDPYDAQLLKSYALVPLRSGDAVIPPIRIELLLRGFRRNQGRRIVSSIPAAIDVAEPPRNSRPAGFHIGNVGQLEVMADVEPSRARIGDTIQLRLTVRGTGLITNLSLPELPELDSARAFDGDDSTTMDVGTDAWLRGVVQRRIAIVPERAGSLEIPPLDFVFYDPWAREYRRATTRPLSVEVSGTAPHAAERLAPSETSSAGDWTDDLPAPRDAAESRRPVSRWHRSPAYFAALALPIFAWLGAGLAARISSRRRASRPERAARNAARNALRDIRSSGDQSDALAQTLRAYLADVTGRPSRGWTAARLRSEVAKLAGDDTATAFADVVERAEQARYGGTTDAAALAKDAAAAIRAVEDVR